MRAGDPSHSPSLLEMPRHAWRAGLLRPSGAVILSGVSLGLALLPATPLPIRADDAPLPKIETLAHRRDQLPRKVVVGSVVCGFDEIFGAPLEKRLQRMDEFLDGMERSEERRVGKECRSRGSPYH